MNLINQPFLAINTLMQFIKSSKNTSIFARLSYLLILACLPISALAQEKNETKSSNIKIENGVLNFSGLLKTSETEEISAYIKAGNIKTLRIQSGGGSIIAAMNLGIIIFENNIDVTVNKYCNSSCANYIFPSGKNKKIEPDSFVLWHGDARQKNFRKELQDLEILFTLKGILAMDESDMQRLIMRRKTMKMQDDFYKLIGINGSIARIGQEIENTENRAKLWALPVSIMNAFGINNIEAPSDYGTIDYCEIKSKKYYPKNGPRCLSISTEEIERWSNMVENK